MRVLNEELRRVADAREKEREREAASASSPSTSTLTPTPSSSAVVAGAFGTGLLMGMYAMCHLRDAGGETAEPLARRDNDFQHAKLVRYYERMGFARVREVAAAATAESEQSPWWVDLGDQLVWGGAGTLMRARVGDVIAQWAKAFK